VRSEKRNARQRNDIWMEIPEKQRAHAEQGQARGCEPPRADRDARGELDTERRPLRRILAPPWDVGVQPNIRAQNRDFLVVDGCLTDLAEMLPAQTGPAVELLLPDHKGMVKARIQNGRETRGPGVQRKIVLRGDADGQGDLKGQDGNPAARHGHGGHSVGEW
jgi:hypothetical protein